MVGLKAVSFATSIVLARLLSPEDFGMVGLLVIFVSIGSVLVDGGMGSSLIRETHVTDLDFTTIFYTNVGVSIALYTLLFFVAPMVGEYYGNLLLTDLLRVYGLTYIISALFITQQSKLIKDLEFKRLAILNLPSTILSGIIAISLALLGFGVWSIIALYLSGHFIKAVLIWVQSDWRPSFSFSKQKLYYHFEYGYKLVMSGILGVFTREVYSLVIGKRFDIPSVGYYTRATSMKNYPVGLFGGILSRVTFPLISKIKEDRQKTSSTYKSILRSSFFVMTMLMTTLIVVAEPLFVVLLTEKWNEAVPYFKILALAGMLVPVHSFNLNIFRIYGRTDILLKLSIIKNALVFMCIPIGLMFGIIGLLWASVAVSVVSLIINSSASAKMIDYGSLQQILDMLPIAAIALLSYGISTYVMNIDLGFSNILSIMTGATCFVTCFLVISRLCKIYALEETIRLSLKLYKGR